ncbi:MAG: cell wall-binding repeat-containing protein [Euzebya sp.]
MTLLLTEPKSARAGLAPSWTQRLAGAAGRLLSGRADRGRRDFLRRAALVGTALAVNPLDFILRPQSAYASVCGPSNECSQGWSAFCCTINGGANTCPSGSYVAGWWKVSSSAFCRGEDRYVVDCNRLPAASCSCHCANGPCDRRRVCCNNFRYGQCNQQIPGTTPVVCRIVICTPPWEWDSACTTAVRTDERTRDHSASCLNGPNPTEIAVVYQDLGLVGSLLGAPAGEETAGPEDGSYRRYEQGIITRSTMFGIAVLTGPVGLAYADLDGPNGPLGYVTGEQVDVAGGQVLSAQGGSLYLTPAGQAFAVTGAVDSEYASRGGPAGWLGFPLTQVLPAPAGRARVDFDAGWSLAFDPSIDEVRLLPSDVELSDQPGQWPPTAGVTRWDGDTRVQTAVRVSREVLPAGASTAVLVTADSFADALAGGVLAGASNGPVLLTGPGELAPDTAEELGRLGVQQVVLVGGPTALSAQVEDQVRALLPQATVRRLAGENRFATAVAVSQQMVPDTATPVTTVYLVSGRDFPDALVATPAAVADRAPLLLTERAVLPDVTRDELLRLNPAAVVIVGGQTTVASSVEQEVRAVTDADVTRIEGPSRYDTAAVAAARTNPATSGAVLIATGQDFADALTAGAASSIVDEPLLLVAKDSTPAVTRQAIARLQPGLIVIVGGPGAVSDAVQQQLAGTPTGPYQTRAVPRAEDH